MSENALVRVCGLVAVVLAAAACTSTGAEPLDPELAPRGTVQTTAKPTRQDLTNKVSLTGKVTMNPLFGIVAPVAGEVRYWTVADPTGTPTKPTRVATVWADGKPTNVDVPAGATFGGRLVDDRAKVTAGMPIASAKHAGYGIVAEVSGEQAYQISDAAQGTVQAQIKNGPGPFPCALLGTIAALPQGTVPAPPPARDPEPDTDATGAKTPAPPGDRQPPDTSSEPTGLRLVCTAPADVKMVNGAAATLELVTASVRDALVVPVEAVAGGQGKGKVDVVGADGAKQTTDVVLGLTDGKVVEIKSGLTGDETLAVPGPNLPPGEVAGQAEPGTGK
ncbi:efflux RND transporter periplasmic adaptor subunit [Saccharothrix sp. S26]|uniref:efflux RND transporter periplasmic adaptor subunit n=1 Tax=Saccharothrix sp. S26 TaxID=2907215 RepID=UPI001F463818|nr:efflux RND transporter periplasmic adaptor subunit [Saccharothrix sp. S26]MCE6996596.1 efflux RND transporter periplasmic adaptor subunit [Saccharothrix sp. S26]